MSKRQLTHKISVSWKVSVNGLEAKQVGNRIAFRPWNGGWTEINFASEADAWDTYRMLKLRGHQVTEPEREKLQ